MIWLTVVCETKWDETKWNETKWDETKWKSVVCEMKICSLRNEHILSRCVNSDILNRKFPPKNRFALRGMRFVSSHFVSFHFVSSHFVSQTTVSLLISCFDERLKKEKFITEKYRNEGVCEINSTTATRND